MTYTYPATVLSVHDADTLRLAIDLGIRVRRRDADLGFGVHVTAGRLVYVEDVRLYGCNAAELSTDAGKAALAFLVGVLSVGTKVTATTYKADKYGARWDASITLPDGRDLTTVMIAAGQAAPWDGTGPKPVPVTVTP